MDESGGADLTRGGPVQPVSRRLVLGMAGVWILILLLAAVRLIRTGRLDPVTVLFGVAGLLQAGSLAAKRKGLKRLLAACGGIVAATTLVLLLLQRS